MDLSDKLFYKSTVYGNIPVTYLGKNGDTPHVITISGKARHGKDTFADFLKQELTNSGFSVCIFHYADLLKMICTNYFGWDGKKDEKGRAILQRVGTEKVRSVNENFWVEMASLIIHTVLKDFDFIIIPDARFENEILYWQEHFPFEFSMSIKVIRTNFESELTSEQKMHASETALDHFVFDYYVENESLEQLKDASTIITDEIKKWVI